MEEEDSYTCFTMNKSEMIASRKYWNETMEELPPRWYEDKKNRMAISLAAAALLFLANVYTPQAHMLTIGIYGICTYANHYMKTKFAQKLNSPVNWGNLNFHNPNVLHHTGIDSYDNRTVFVKELTLAAETGLAIFMPGIAIGLGFYHAMNTASLNRGYNRLERFLHIRQRGVEQRGV